MRPASTMKDPALWRKFETHLLNEGLTQLRIHKLHTMFVVAERGLAPGLAAATRPDIEKFVERLSRGTFLREDGKPYSGTTKADVKKFLKQFYKWLRGEGRGSPRTG